MVPTHNRSARLLPLVDALRREFDGLPGAELIVVDSASTDDTSTVARSACDADPARARVVRVDRPGLCRARNAGVAAARGAIVVFVDDDVRPRPGCVAALVTVFDDPAVHGAGGRIVLRFEAPPPSWYSPSFAGYLAAHDLGNDDLDVTAGGPDAVPRGAFMAFRRDVVRRLGGFCELFGNQADRPMVGDEYELCRRLVAHGGRLRYVANAVVEHLVPGARLAPPAMARRFYYQGMSEAFADIRFAGARVAWVKLLRGVGRRLTGAAWDGTGPAAGNAVLAGCRRRQSLGYAAGVLAGMLQYPRLRRIPT